MTKKSTSQPAVASLLRGLEVMRCFSGRPSLGSSDIAKMTGLPQPTVWRLCKTLEGAGYLVSEPGLSKFRLGLAVLTLGFAALETRDVAELARPSLQAIADEFHGVTALSTRHGLGMLYLQRCESADAFLKVKLRIGSEIPMGATGTGWAYLAGLTDGSRRALLETIKKTVPEDWRRIEKLHTKAMDDFRKTGYVVSSDVFFKGLTTVAVPFGGPDEKRLHVLNCSLLTPLLSNERLRELGLALKRLAGQLQSALQP